MTYVNINVDLEIQDFVDSLTRRDISELIEILKEEGHIKENSSQLENDNKLSSDDFDSCLNKIASSYFEMDLKDIDLIRSISKKYRW